MNNTSLFDLHLQSTGASIDSRTIRPGQIFFGLSGENSDGSQYAEKALEGGALAVVLRHDVVQKKDDHRYWYVKNVLATMQELAKEYRRWLDCTVMAITGSNGKTTNKNLLNAALSTRYRIHSTAGNFNNHIGLPLTILNAPSDTDFLLLEMGTNHFGEIRDLCRIAEPDYGSIINVGKSHLEFLESVEGVLRAKSELADSLVERGGQLFLNKEEPSLQALLDHPVQKIMFDREALPRSDFRMKVHRSSPDIELELYSVLGGKRYRLTSPLWGEHNVRNLLHTLAVGTYFEAGMEQMVEVLSRYEPADNRSQIISWKGHRVFLDAYNANPTSMAQAIRSFRAANPNQGVLILGEMGELGEVAGPEHESILRLVEELGFDQVYLVGTEFKRVGEERFSDFRYVSDVMDLETETWPSGSPILLKGSRFMALERLIRG